MSSRQNKNKRKSKNQLKSKIKEIKDKLFDSSEEGHLFSYWLGYLRALEWLLGDDK